MRKLSSKESLEALKPYVVEIIEKYKDGYTAEQRDAELAKVKELVFALNEEDLDEFNEYLDGLDA